MFFCLIFFQTLRLFISPNSFAIADRNLSHWKVSGWSCASQYFFGSINLSKSICLVISVVCGHLCGHFCVGHLFCMQKCKLGAQIVLPTVKHDRRPFGGHPLPSWLTVMVTTLVICSLACCLRGNRSCRRIKPLPNFFISHARQGLSSPGGSLILSYVSSLLAALSWGLLLVMTTALLGLSSLADSISLPCSSSLSTPSSLSLSSTVMTLVFTRFL